MLLWKRNKSYNKITEKIKNYIPIRSERGAFNDGKIRCSHLYIISWFMSKQILYKGNTKMINNTHLKNKANGDCKTAWIIYKSNPINIIPGSEYQNRVKPKFYEFWKK